MKIKLETNRFILREFEVSDVQNIFDLDSDPRVHTYLGNQTLKNIKEAEIIINSLISQYKENGIARWAVIDKQSKEFIGWSGLKYCQDDLKNENYYDIGYRFKVKFWGQKIAQETAKACLKYGFETMNIGLIYGDASVENIASNIVLRKIGLKYLEQYYYKNETENILCNRYGLSYDEYVQNLTYISD